MASMLSTLLSARTRKARNETQAKAARARANRARPGVESLDRRCLLAVSASFNPVSGILDIATDVGYNTVAKVTVTPQGRINVWNDYKANQAQLATVNPLASQVKKINFTSNEVDSNVWVELDNYTNIDTDYHLNASNGIFYGGGATNRFYGGNGIGTCMGGPGTNYFFDSANSLDDYEAGAGDNVLYRASDHTYLQSRPGVTPKSMLTVGLRDKAYSDPASLNVQGIDNTLTAYLDSTHTVLTLSGPTGGGFQVDGNWTDTYAGGVHTFKATGTLYLETGLTAGGSQVRLPINTLGQTFAISTKPTSVADPVGQFAGMTWAGAMPLNSSGGGSGALGALSSQFGLNFNLPGTQWGIKMGADLAKSTGMPLLANVPYLYLSSNAGASVSFGSHISVSTPGAGFTIALDPSDPALFTQFVTPQGTFSAGGSLQGAIPYSPVATPDAVGNPNINGNLYLSAGSIALGELPLAASGSVVIDFDANNDGKLAGINKDSINNLLTGKSSLSSLASSVASDVAFGFNGGVALSTEAYGLNLSADVAQGSAFYTPKLMGGPGVAFEVTSVNPFAGTALAAFTPNSQVAVGGYFSKNASTGKLNWGFSASTSSVALGGMIGGAASFQASSATNTVQVDVSMAGFLGAASLKLDGVVSLTTGDFDLSQSLNIGMDLGIARASVSEVFHFARKNGTTSIYVAVGAYLQLGDSTTNFHAGLSGNIYVAVDSSGHATFAGSGTVYAGLTLAATANDVSVGFGFDNNGFRVTVLGYTIQHGW